MSLTEITERVFNWLEAVPVIGGCLGVLAFVIGALFVFLIPALVVFFGPFTLVAYFTGSFWLSFLTFWVGLFVIILGWHVIRR
jgi:hypothetical protein